LHHTYLTLPSTQIDALQALGLVATVYGIRSTPPTPAALYRHRSFCRPAEAKLQSTPKMAVPEFVRKFLLTVI
jgi:hypothetical protein